MYTTFKTDITKVGSGFLISNFFTRKISHGRNWCMEKAPSRRYLPLCKILTSGVHRLNFIGTNFMPISLKIVLVETVQVGNPL